MNEKENRTIKPGPIGHQGPRQVYYAGEVLRAEAAWDSYVGESGCEIVEAGEAGRRLSDAGRGEGEGDDEAERLIGVGRSETTEGAAEASGRHQGEGRE
jgi:hypothetical protein